MFSSQFLMVGAIALGLSAPVPESGRSAPLISSSPIRPVQACPADLDRLMPLLLRDLPAYANRVSQRSFHRYGSRDRPGIVILASRPDYGPLSLGPGPYTPVPAETEPQQVFFTTLERQYVSDEAGVLLQAYHWAFLAQSEDGRWRLALLFSSPGGYPAGEPPSPPDDTSDGAIAQAMRLWLRDCAAGAVAGDG